MILMHYLVFSTVMLQIVIAMMRFNNATLRLSVTAFADITKMLLSCILFVIFTAFPESTTECFRPIPALIQWQHAACW